MGKVIPFPQKDQYVIKIIRTDEYIEISRKFEEFLMALPLTEQQLRKIGEFLSEQVRAAEHGAFTQGFGMGYQFAIDNSNNS